MTIGEGSVAGCHARLGTVFPAEYSYDGGRSRTFTG